MAEIKTDGNTSRALYQDQMDDVISSRATGQNLSGPSPIQRTLLNHNDSHSCVLSVTLIKD